ncbi:MAG: hypothetical protein K5755_00670 [Clostridiales bacterium]|nr:hypothetical protein [Clostridiales bacterium]
MKKIIIAVSVVALITVGLVAGIIGYHNKYYDISVGIPEISKEADGPAISTKELRENNESFLLFPMFSFGDKAPQKQLGYMEEISEDIDNFQKNFIAEYKQPYFIECKYENKNGSTVITYKGEVTNPKTGELEPFERVFPYPYIVTKNIDNPEPNDTYYFKDLNE